MTEKEGTMTKEQIEAKLRKIDGLLFDETIDPMIAVLALLPERNRLQGLLDDMEQAS